MPQVSKYPLSNNTERRLYQLFWETISELKESSKAEEFFNDLLSPTEKIMLSKRLAVVIMLQKGYGYSTIRSTLKVSPGTIGSVSAWLKYSGIGYRKVFNKLLKKEKFKEIISSLESAIDLITPEKTFNRVMSKGFPNGKFKKPF